MMNKLELMFLLLIELLIELLLILLINLRSEYSLWYLFCISSPAGPSVFWPECWRKSGIRNGNGVGMRME